jgi:sensor histidine kinase YesM
MDNRRSIKNFLINPEYQLRFILAIALPCLVLLGGNLLILYPHVREKYDLLTQLHPESAEMLSEELRTVMWGLVLVSMIFLSGVTALAAIFSHRSAGPLYHFRKIFEQIRAGDHSARIRLRPRDDFREVAESFNLMMDERFKL